jgi:hypothetical protein
MNNSRWRRMESDRARKRQICERFLDRKVTEDNKERLDSLLSLKEAIEARIANVSEEERMEVEALSKRAITPECAFDRKYREQLYALALFPGTVSWHFKLRERLHSLIHHH